MLRKPALRRHCAVYVAFAVVLYLTVIHSGLYQYLLALPYGGAYQHPGSDKPLSLLIDKIQEKVPVTPIHSFTIPYKLINTNKCISAKVPAGNGEAVRNIKLVFVVSSRVSSFYRRDIIRQSWGYERRFTDINIKTVFLIGTKPTEPHVQARLAKEHKKFKDIVQGDFVDSDQNLPLKTEMGLHWAFHFCNTTKYFFFVDDDQYVSTRNILRFLRNPKHYPQYLETLLVGGKEKAPEFLYAGHVFEDMWPDRFTFSEDYVPMHEYPFSRYPPFVSTGAYLLSQKSAQMLYYAGLYTVPFRLPHVYLGMLAKKAGLHLTHQARFDSDATSPDRYTVSQRCQTSPDGMLALWQAGRAAGSA